MQYRRNNFASNFPLSFFTNHLKLVNLIPVTPEHCGDNHNCETQASTKRILDNPLYKTNNYGTEKYNCIVDWNHFKRIFPYLSEIDYTYSKLKSLITQYFSNTSDKYNQNLLNTS